MKFIVDAQLPRRLARRLQEAGHDAIHTLDLPAGNRTPVKEIIRLAEAEERIVITKDADFVDEHLVRGRPRRLLFVATGNISNTELEGQLLRNLERIVGLLISESSFLELGRGEIRIHE